MARCVSACPANKLLALADNAHVAVEVVELDVADDERVKTGVGEVLDSAGHVDVLVNNAGIGPSGVVEETPSARFLEVMNVNLCGAVRARRPYCPRCAPAGLAPSST